MHYSLHILEPWRLAVRIVSAKCHSLAGQIFTEVSPKASLERGGYSEAIRKSCTGGSASLTLRVYPSSCVFVYTHIEENGDRAYRVSPLC